MGGNVGSPAIRSVAWSVGIALLSYLWARSFYTHRPAT
jgi:hypothetical protein